MKLASPSLLVVVPMFNEEVGAARCVQAVCRVLDSLSVPSQMLVVEDGSGDSTKEVLENLKESHPNLNVVYHDGNRGYGRALSTGAQYAAANGFEYVLFMDSDLTNDPADIPRFVEQMRRGIDVIKATRYSHGGRVEGVPLYRVLISRLGNLVASGLWRLPLRDSTNGFRAVKVDLLKRISLKENNFSIIMEEIYRLKPLARSYAQVPVRLTNRADDLRGTSFRYRPSIFVDYLKYPVKSFIGF